MEWDGVNSLRERNMISELSFLISLLLNDKTPFELKAVLAERIKEVEQSLGGNRSVSQVVRPIQNMTIQAASTQAILDQTPTTNGAMIPTQNADPAHRIMGGEKITGNGTRGPRKF